MKKIFVLSECSDGYAQYHLGVTTVHSIPIETLAWKRVAQLGREAKKEGSHAEKRLLDEMLQYLGGLVTMQNANSNLVYVVMLLNETPAGWSISFVDIVKKKHHYFHPFGGNGWPKNPPNYVGFRRHGRRNAV